MIFFFFQYAATVLVGPSRSGVIQLYHFRNDPTLKTESSSCTTKYTRQPKPLRWYRYDPGTLAVCCFDTTNPAARRRALLDFLSAVIRYFTVLY